MAISVDWPTGVITIPKDYMIVVPSSIVNELRQLDSDQLRKDLRALESSEEGRPFPIAVRYVGPRELGGVTYGSFIEITDYYTVTFEDGAYRVAIVGSNNNIADRTNLNQVSVQPNNSTGLQNQNVLLSSAYNAEVFVDPVNGQAGTVIPLGTRLLPVNNLADAKAICEIIGAKTIRLASSMVIDTVDFSDGYLFTSDNPVVVTATLDPSADLSGCQFENLTVTGTLDGNSVVRECVVYDIDYVDGYIYDCSISGTISLTPLSQATIANCFSNVAGGGPGQTPTIDMGGNASLAMRGWEGGIQIENYSGGGAVSMDLNSGRVIVDSTVTAGDLYIRGLGIVTDNSTGTANVEDQTIIKDIQSAGYADGRIWVDTTAGAPGTTAFTNGVADNPVSNWADAVVLAATLGIKGFHIANGSIIQLTSDSTGYDLKGDHWTLALNGQEITDAYFEGAHVQGIGTVDPGAEAMFRECDLGDVALATVGRGTFIHCGIYNLKLTVGDYSFTDCHSGVPGTGAPTVDFTAGVDVINAFFRRWSGGLTCNNLTANDTVSVDAVSGGTITLNGADAVVAVRGMVQVTNNLTGTPTVTSGQVINTTAIKAQADQALADYDPPTKAEMDSGFLPIATSAEIAALNDVSILQVQAEVLAATSPLATQVSVDALNDISTAQVRTQVDDALAAFPFPSGSGATPAQVRAEIDASLVAYDPPTKAELDNAVAPLATAASIAALNDVSILQVQAEILAATSPLATAIQVAALNDISPAQVNAEVDQALADFTFPTGGATPAQVKAQVDQALLDYDGPTKAEMDSAFLPIATSAEIAALNDLSLIQLQTELGNYTSPLATAASIAALNNISAADVLAQASAALVSYDPPTKAELDAAVAPLASLATSAEIAALNNLSAAQVQASAYAALVTYDPPTKAELDAAVAPLATQASVAAIPTDGLASTDPRLDFLDAAISSRSTFDNTVDTVITDDDSRRKSRSKATIPL